MRFCGHFLTLFVHQLIQLYTNILFRLWVSLFNKCSFFVECVPPETVTTLYAARGRKSLPSAHRWHWNDPKPSRPKSFGRKTWTFPQLDYVSLRQKATKYNTTSHSPKVRQTITVSMILHSKKCNVKVALHLIQAYRAKLTKWSRQYDHRTIIRLWS